MEDVMQFREQAFIVESSPTYFRDMVLAAIRELEADYQAGEVDYASYFHRMHAMERMLK